jgi:hypothetical protein
MSYYEEARARATVLMSCGVGRHAELAKQIVGGIDPVLRSALLAYHTSSLPFDRQARELLDIERDVYSARLAEAHAAIAMREDRYILLADAFLDSDGHFVISE